LAAALIKSMYRLQFFADEICQPFSYTDWT